MNNTDKTPRTFTWAYIDELIKTYREWLFFLSESKRKAFDNADAWLKYNYVYSDSVDLIFSITPKSREEADELIETAFTDDFFIKQATKISKKHKTISADIDDLILAYSNHRYKLACLVLCPLLDKYFRKKFSLSSNYLKYNNIENITTNVKSELRIVELYKKLFKPQTGKILDKITEMPVRNILLHGNSLKEYRKSDVIKLFLLLDAIMKTRIKRPKIIVTDIQ